MRLEARASLLRAHTGLIHHFEKLLGSAPLNLLLTLPEAEMEREETDAVISDFLSQPLSCLNLCGRRMRALCKKPSDVYSKLEDPLRALGLGGVLDSAGVERDAAQVRKDLSNAMVGQPAVLSKLSRAYSVRRFGRNMSLAAAESQQRDLPLPQRAQQAVKSRINMQDPQSSVSWALVFRSGKRRTPPTEV